MKRFKMFFRFDREEKWLEEMAGNGWLLCGKGLFYDFQIGRASCRERV